LKKLVLVLLFLILSSCASRKQLVRIPNFENAWQIVTEPSPNADSVSYAMTIFYSSWQREFGDRRLKVFKAIDSLMIEWSTERRKVQGYSTLGNFKTDAYIGGATLSPGYVWILIREDNKISSSSLIHELVHVSLWAIDPSNSGDDDHEGPRRKGWTKKHTIFIEKIKNILKQKGL
tara:strand:+ start:2612 stop:3139 length:528 start_codon:yes stop_codon:yes gene_type:complete